MPNTNSGRKFSICTTPQADDLDATEFAALTFVEVGGVGSLGETGSRTNILSYDTWDTAVVQKQKGTTDAGSPELELANDPSDTGQQALKTAAGTNFYYAFCVEGNDKLNPTGTNSKRYYRGLVAGPTRPNGRNEDFDLIVYTLGLVQAEIVVAATAGA